MPAIDAKARNPDELLGFPVRISMADGAHSRPCGRPDWTVFIRMET